MTRPNTDTAHWPSLAQVLEHSADPGTLAELSTDTGTFAEPSANEGTLADTGAIAEPGSAMASKMLKPKQIANFNWKPTMKS